MNRFTLTVVLSLMINSIITAQTSSEQILKINNSTSFFRVTESTATNLSVEVNFSELKYTIEETVAGQFIEFSDYGNSTEIGFPQLPIQKKLIQIPIGADINIESLTYTEKEIQLNSFGINYKIKPYQTSVAKSQDPNNVAFELNQNAYNSDAFSNEDVISIEILGIKRGVQIARLSIAPVRYNPKSNTIKVFSNIKAEISFTGTFADPNAYSDTKSNSILLNSKSFSKAETNTSIKYLIIADANYKDSIQNFINWKTKKGFEVIEVYPGENGVGTTAENIKTHLQSIYEEGTADNPPPRYGLIIGDHGQIPAFKGKKGDHVTDLHYFEYTGDYFPEMYYGRFSANNFDELMPQLNKTIEYEKYSMDNPSFLDKVALVAGVDVSWGPAYANAHVNYGFENYFNEEHGYTSHNYLHPRSGNFADEIKDKVNNGVGLVKYSGHCLPSGWLNPVFSTNDIFELSNNGKYPTIFGNCCESVRFENYSSFGEIWLRAKDKGAVGYIGASNLSYWVEDYYFDIGFGDNGATPSYDKTTNAAMDLMFHENDEAFETWASTNGEIVQAGNMSVTAAGTDRVDYYWEVYHLMGDPSLMTYLTTPDKMDVEIPKDFYIGTNNISIKAESGAYVALTVEGELIDSKYANNSGIAILALPYFEEEVLIDVVITKQNKEPFFASINGIKQVNAEVTYIDHQISDSIGNKNNMAEFGETTNINIATSNIGFSDANNLVFKLSSSSDLIQITNDSFTLSTYEARTNQTNTSAFTFLVNDNLIGSSVIPFKVNLIDDKNNNWEFEIEIEVHGPNVLISDISINDKDGGNNNLTIDAGEIVKVNYQIQNIGKANTNNLTAQLDCTNPLVNILKGSHSITEIASDSISSGEFIIAIDPDFSENNDSFELLFAFSNDNHNFEYLKTYRITSLTEEFEAGNLELYNWNTSVNNAWIPFEASENENAFSGKWGLKSAPINNDDTSNIELKVNTILDDTISFYKRVSCQDTSLEGAYRDYLEFAIDGEIRGIWAGESNWSFEKYSLSKGEHILRWRYIKNKFTAEGDDCAWIDLIQFPIEQLYDENTYPSISSAPDTLAIIGQEYSYTIEGSDTDGDNINYSTTDLPEWLTLTDNGDGNANISGTPEQAHKGQNQVILSVFDGKASNYQIFNISVNNKTSLSYKDSEKDILVYPNPSKGIINIEYLNSNQAIGSIKIYDATGRLLEQFESGKNYETLDLKYLHSGIYYVHIKTNQQAVTRKIYID